MERYVEFIFYEDTGKVIFRWRTEGKWSDFLASRRTEGKWSDFLASRNLKAAVVPNIPLGDGPPNSLTQPTHFELTELPLVIRGRINMLRIADSKLTRNSVPGVGYRDSRVRLKRSTESATQFIQSFTLGVCVDEEDIKQLREIYPPLVIEDEVLDWTRG